MRTMIRVFVGPEDRTIDLVEDDLMQIEHVDENWIFENDERHGTKRLVLVQTDELDGFPPDLSRYFCDPTYRPY